MNFAMNQKLNSMKPNLDLRDMIIRLILMLVLIIGGWLLQTFILFPIGMYLVVTTLSAYCPIYEKLGINHQS